MQRRGFFGSLLAVLAGPTLAKRKPGPGLRPPRKMKVGWDVQPVSGSILFSGSPSEIAAQKARFGKTLANELKGAMAKLRKLKRGRNA